MSSEKCSVEGCEEPAHKNVSSNAMPVIQQLGLKVSFKGKKIPLCRKHYRLVKKALRASRTF